jgi:hypothetical protein
LFFSLRRAARAASGLAVPIFDLRPLDLAATPADDGPQSRKAASAHRSRRAAKDKPRTSVAGEERMVSTDIPNRAGLKPARRPPIF